MGVQPAVLAAVKRGRVAAVDVTVDPNQIEGARLAVGAGSRRSSKDVGYVVGCYVQPAPRNTAKEGNEAPATSFAEGVKNPPGKLADAEPYFNEGPLAGLKMIGWAIWERRGSSGRNVTFPARQCSVNGERRRFAPLRPITDTETQNRIRDFILRGGQKRRLAQAS